MPSPFPGMNPFLEQDDVWNTFHHHFILASMEALFPQVRPRYTVHVGEHVYIHEVATEDEQLIGLGDIALSRGRISPTGNVVGSTAGTLTAPVPGRIVPATLEERQPFVEVRDRRGGEVVAILELLSPSNKKSGRDRQQYLGKRDQVFDSPAHFIELDLLRGGPRLPVEGLPPCDYYVLVSRAERRPDVELWPWSLRQTMPSIPIPLAANDPDAHLDLQALLHRVYDTSSYADYIYLDDPQPALSPENAVWARSFVPS
jgi:hypothetical protein